MDITADFLSGLSVVLVTLASLAAYLLQRARSGVVSYERVERQGGGTFIGLGLLTFGFWVLQGVGRRLAKASIPADSISWLGLVLAVFSGWAVGTENFGVAALAAFLSGSCDALDGMVAGLSGTKSPGGVVLDSTLDRYGDFALLCGAAVLYRHHVSMMVMSLLAIHGSYMVSYSTAKAEAMGKKAPGGSMKRPERWALLLGGMLLAGVTGPFLSPADAAFGWPFAAAVALVAVLANVAAARRLYFVWSTAGDRP